MKKYECLYIVNINVDSEGTSAVSARVEGLLKNVGAEVKNTQPWGKRKLAYAIDKERYGDYVLIHFEGENPDLTEFHRELEIESAVLHYMTIRLDEFPDFDSLSVPQTIDADRKRPGGRGDRGDRGDRRPRYEDREAAPAAVAEEAEDIEAPVEDIEATETVEEAVEAPEETEAAEVTEAVAEEEAPEVSEEVAPEEAPEETEAVAEEAPVEDAEASETDETKEEKPADSE